MSAQWRHYAAVRLELHNRNTNRNHKSDLWPFVMHIWHTDYSCSEQRSRQFCFFFRHIIFFSVKSPYVRTGRARIAAY